MEEKPNGEVNPGNGLLIPLSMEEVAIIPSPPAGGETLMT
jgi:hypothetical protein